MAGIIFKHVKKVYDKNFEIVKDFNLEIADKEFVILVGPSGCGKSTTLRMIAGLEDITSGELYIGDKLVNDVAPKDRNIAMVFQNYALYPHMTVYKNMSFGLELKKMPKPEIEERVMRVAKILDIEDYLKRKPKALSGGQRQRVALGRAMVRDPHVFLLDEPLSNLDAKLRVQMRTELIKLHERLGTTFVYVTHDQVEAMTMGDRIVVMKSGDIMQVASAKELYEHPTNLFVAGFIGSPQMNLMPAKLAKEGSGWKISFAKYSFVVKDINIDDKYDGKDVTFGIRPDYLYHDSDADLPVIDAKVDVTEMIGAETYIYIVADGIKMTAKVPSASDVKMDQDIDLKIDTQRIHLFDKETELSIIQR